MVKSQRLPVIASDKENKIPKQVQHDNNKMSFRTRFGISNNIKPLNAFVLIIKSIKKTDG
jgi:hypothetical protein